MNAGLLRHRSGRYKALATLNPNSVPNSPASKELATDGQKSEEKKSKSDVRAPIGDVESSRQTQERKYAVIFLRQIYRRLFLRLRLI